jgi:hypothetical protein
MSKKALTPLISTLLLITFAVGLGALVMSWGNTQQFSTCEEIDIAVTSLKDDSSVCLKDNLINLIIENNGAADIEKMDIVILTPNSVFERNYDVNIKSGQFKHITLSDIDVDSEILKIRLIPYRQDSRCVESRFEIETIDNC